MFHIAVLIGAVPADQVWAGKAVDNIVIMESISLVFTILFAIAIGFKYHSILKKRTSRFITIVTRVIFAFFVQNAVMNLISANAIENYIFAPLSIILATLILRLALE